MCFAIEATPQCLSSVNPVGGTESLLVLEKKSLRVISFYRYGQGNKYFARDSHSDFINLIDKAYYNYLSVSIGYGLLKRLTLEAEIGYYANKTQVYSTQPEYTLTGRGMSNLTFMPKLNVYTNHVKRIYASVGIGVKVPFSRDMQVVDNVQLPVEIQPTLGAYGVTANATLVKENPEKGWRFFVTNRTEIHGKNKLGYKMGSAVFNSVYASKHLMFPWLNGDWTTIVQLRQEIRTRDIKIGGGEKESSGGMLFFIVPQLNYVAFGKWNLSAMVDIPIYQYFNGTQLGAGLGATLSISRVFKPDK